MSSCLKNMCIRNNFAHCYISTYTFELIIFSPKFIPLSLFKSFQLWHNYTCKFRRALKLSWISLSPLFPINWNSFLWHPLFLNASYHLCIYRHDSGSFPNSLEQLWLSLPLCLQFLLQIHILKNCQIELNEILKKLNNNGFQSKVHRTAGPELTGKLFEMKVSSCILKPANQKF